MHPESMLAQAGGGAATDTTNATDAIVCQCLEGHVPACAESELDRLHPGRYAALAHLQVYGKADGASTYVARRAGIAVALFLYRRHGALVHVLNEGMALDAGEALRCAAQLLRGPRAPAAVRFHAVEWQRTATSPLLQVAPCMEDAMLALPASSAAYLNGLGASTRANLKNRLNRLRRELPGFQFAVYEKEAVPPQHLRAIIDFHHRRMAEQHKTSQLDGAEEQRMRDMVARCGLVSVILSDGRCCGGSICYRHGNLVSGRVLAHDPAHDNLRLGFLCAYLTASACIDMGGIQRFHFGWGQSEYKAHLGAQPRTLSDVLIYRSALQRLRLLPWSLGLTLRGLAFHARRRIAKAIGRDSQPGQRLAAVLATLRRWRWRAG